MIDWEGTTTGKMATKIKGHSRIYVARNTGKSEGPKPQARLSHGHLFVRNRSDDNLREGAIGLYLAHRVILKFGSTSQSCSIFMGF